MSSSRSVILLDLEQPYRGAFEAWARRRGLACFALEGEFLALEKPFECVLCVVGIDEIGEHCADKVQVVRKTLRTCPIVLLAEGIGTDEVVQVMHAGAVDVIGLPASEKDVTERAARCIGECRDEVADDSLIGGGHSMQRLRRDMAAVASMRSTVLLTGETGVGKGLVARQIHKLSDRREHPFVHADCASLAPTVIESELFGHERGSFTGAVGRNPGRFSLARDGTIFLDEIGDLAPTLQAKLLRVLEDREYERLGGSETLSMTARVIAATNRDLRADVEDGAFRADLFFRLEVFHIEIPPLRQRPEDIPVLVDAAIQGLAERLQVPRPRIVRGFYEKLREYSWPGNVRQLHNVLERLVIRYPGAVLDEVVVAELFDSSPGPAPRREFAARPASEPVFESHGDREDDREDLAAALDAAGGNVARVARRLGIPRSTLRYRIQKLGLDSLIPQD